MNLSHDQPPVARQAAPKAQGHDQASKLIVTLAQDIWRLKEAVRRSRERGETVGEAVAAVIERLVEDLEVGGVEFIDPVGQKHDPGVICEVAERPAGGEGELYISETLVPGVRLAGKLLAIPTVILRPGGKR